jgi:hypothetical protein
MQCACKRWGSGTTCEKPINTENAKELETKMKQMIADREKQNNFWTMPSSSVGSNKLESTQTSTVINSQQQMRFWN